MNPLPLEIVTTGIPFEDKLTKVKFSARVNNSGLDLDKIEYNEIKRLEPLTRDTLDGFSVLPDPLTISSAIVSSVGEVCMNEDLIFGVETRNLENAVDGLMTIEPMNSTTSKSLFFLTWESGPSLNSSRLFKSRGTEYEGCWKSISLDGSVVSCFAA
ncbi:hypothetical protein WICPIJ_000615 [Wickerhamomyces pijperi]|uniref:Uncharacterized protein n=1 Tax=Wickerhamomyces pijperi TaxID=599730 RepID=A0A9P8QD62_WICPI|nr:hypothetical protein WICPIJ_000615 [Wickerhamomyces pijperi]